MTQNSKISLIAMMVVHLY